MKGLAGRRNLISSSSMTFVFFESVFPAFLHFYLQAKQLDRHLFEMLFFKIS